MSEANESVRDSARDFADAARALQAQHDLSSTLHTICALAVEVAGADHAAITTVRQGQFRTVASTSEIPRIVDQLQYASNEGPCVDAIRDEDTFLIGDLAHEPRWPTFAPLAAEQTGVQSMLSERLFVREGTLGALNIYAHRKDAFSKDLQRLTGIFATHAAVALAAAEDHQRADNLEVALANSRRIGVAMGILMRTEGLTEDEAFAVLAARSQQTNRRLVEIAEDVAYTGVLADDTAG